MHPPTKHVEFTHAVSAARQSKVNIRNVLTGATVSVRPDDAKHAAPSDGNGSQLDSGETASAAGMLFVALISTVFGPDAPLHITLNTVNNKVISASITVTDEQPGAHHETALKL